MYSLKEISKTVHGQLKGDGNRVIAQLSIDSRSVMPGEQVLFFCIRGPRNDGHDYIDELYGQGVLNFIVEKIPQVTEKYPNACFVSVENSVKALQQLAAFHRSRFSCPVVGVTGSNGKTIVKEWLWHCLNPHMEVTRNPKSYNSQVGVPLSVWLMNKQTELAIFEAGISKPGEMEALQPVITPSIGIFTNIGEAHQENFTDLRQKALEKFRLFKDSEAIVYCRDHELIHSLVMNAGSKLKRCDWSCKNPEAFVYVEEITKKETSTSMHLLHKTNPFHIEIPFIDEASIENSMHVVTLLLYLAIRPESMIESLSSMPPVAMRLELKKGVQHSTLINDSYNSDINSLTIALDYLSVQTREKGKTLILSDILQSGQDEKSLYRKVARLVSEKEIDRFYGIGPALSRNKDVFTVPSSFFSDTDSFIQKVSPEQFANQSILLKGAREFAFEKISRRLEEQVHKTVMEINLNGLVHNLNFYRSLLRPSTKIMVMLKAFAYGSGTYEVANVLQHNKVDYFGVAFIDEGIALRQAGVKTPIMVMSPESSAYESLVRYNLEPELYNLDSLRGFNSFLFKNGIPDYPVHLKIDTGMHRLGFMPEEIDTLCEELRKSGNIKVKSVFSHLAASDSSEFDVFTVDQIKQYEAICVKIEKVTNRSFIRHILNSSGIERFTEHQMDMVRLGIGLYGISTRYQEKLQTVSCLKSKIIQIKHLMPAETVGYSRKGKLSTEGKIAVVPIGYADGLDRKLSNGAGYFMVNGKPAPIIGNICMDLTMIDITHINAHENDEVIIFGEKPTPIELAETLQTIPYEIFTNISPRVKRVYLHD